MQSSELSSVRTSFTFRHTFSLEFTLPPLLSAYPSDYNHDDEGRFSDRVGLGRLDCAGLAHVEEAMMAIDPTQTGSADMETKKKEPVAPDPAPPAPMAPASEYSPVIEPDGGLTPLYQLIQSATKSIDLTMYELSDSNVIGFLTAAAGKGVAVRVILDQNNEKANNTAAFNSLMAGKVAVHWANPGYLCTHQKSLTIDGATSAIMTLNFVPVDYPTSRDFAVITTNVADVAAIETTFNADFVDGTITPPTGTNLVWSPTNSRSTIEGLINNATESLLVAQEELEDPGLESALAAALKRGVALTMVQENLKGEYSKALNPLKAAGAKIAIYSSRTGYYIHAKIVLADYGTAKASLFVGSENFTTDSLDKNRELGLVFNDQVCMESVRTAVLADYNNGTKY